jgi:predicted nuclease of predicted toxin-antitoxin system
MLRLLTDENFNKKILRGLTRRSIHADILSVRNAGLAGQPDEFLLKWAATENRTILTHDINTMKSLAEELLIQGEPMAGVILVPDSPPIGHAIDDLQLMIECYSQSEMYNQKVSATLSERRRQNELPEVRAGVVLGGA